MSQQQQMSSQQRVVKQSTSVQQQSSSFSMQQSSVQQQSQTQTSVRTQVQQGTQRVQGPTQMVPVGLPAGASPPVFEQIFQNARFAQGGDALFEGKVQGSPKPTVTWTRRGQQISSGNKYEVSHDEVSGVVTLLIRAIGPGDEGEYTCTAANQYGEAICTVYIQPEAAYMMQQQRQQMQQSSVQSQMHIQKQQQMSLMQNGYSESFRVDTFEHRILHEVEFRQSLCMRLEGEVEMGGVTIQGPPTAPQLQQKPRSTKVADGGNATFTVNLHANPSPRVIWFKNGSRLQQSEKFLMTASAGQATLVIKNVNSSDNGYYTMVAENRSGCTVASAQLAVVPKGEDVTNGHHVPEVIRPTSAVEPMEIETDESGKTLEPKFVLVPRDRESQEGKMVRFDCRVTGRPYPEVTWFLNGQTIADDATHKVLVNEAGNHSLMITEVSLMDNGTITCVARNKSGEATFQVALHVLEREQIVSPKFVERFQQGQVKEGETVVLHARAVGTPMPSMSWQKDGVTIDNSASMQIQSDGQGSSNLQILSASVADAGWYSCNASNVAGSTSTRARLHVVADKNAPAMPQRPHFPKPTTVIQPQPEPAPEIINLRPVERAHHQPRAPEEERPTEPPMFTVPLRDIDLEEGKRAHFEAKLTPVGDATMNVEWLLDGRPLAASSRATTTYRFGYVALDILNVIKADTGVYTCRASNVMGQAEVSANLRITEKPVIDTSSQHTDAMKQMNYMEQQATYQKNVSIEEAINIKPNFVKSLANLGEVSEGKYAHFEAQLHPVSDPFMRIEWFKDGKTITASSRINVIYNFGYVALNIMHLRPEDSGTYSVRATNKAGECTCSATIKVIAIGNVTGDLGIPEQSSYIKSVEEMEAYRLKMLQKQTTEFVQSTQAPVFKSELKDTSAREGGYAHFEARLEPIGDPSLKVEWLKDGRPLEASARITAFYNFGYVALTIKQLIIQDAGTYTCVATNTLGKSQVKCTLVVISKTEKEVESHYSETVQKMEYMEDSSRYQRNETEETTVTIAPKFVGQMKGTNKIVEGQKAHFEVRLEPQSDSTMTVEWYFNSTVIMSASRIKLYNDFGYVSLDISDVRSSDSGTYTVVARNALGEAQLSTQMIVETRSGIDYSTMHEVTMSKTTAMERRAHQEPQYDIDEHTKAKPTFTVLLADPKPVSEGKNIHLEARLEPVGDPTMRVEWFFNGKPLTVGSRFKTYFDFGFVALDILSVYANDTGEYTCRAENALGSAHTSAQVQVLGTSYIESETMHGEAMEQISYLENARNQRGGQEETEINQAPTFAKSLKNIETIEGTNIHLEARLQPVGDSSMRIEWFFNDEPLKVGHRFRPAYDFDYVALDLLSVYPYDSGIYTCRATNKLGQAVSSASVKITEATGVVITNEQTTLTMEQLTMLESRNRHSRTEIIEETTKQAPVFTTALKNLEILEGQRAHFEVRLIPTSDPTMKIEWFHDNKPIKSGSRFTEYNDFGFVALDIMYAYAEDSGTYTCVATNCLGQATSTCTLLCHTKESILVDTMNAEAMSKISQLETRTTRTVTSEEMVMQAPVFTAPMRDQNLIENAPLHFEARLIPVGDPDLKVEWFKNGVPIQQANRITTMHDFGYVALDMKYVNPEDSGTYTCRATNRLGQAVTSATLVVTSKESLLMESQHSEALEKLRFLEDSSRYSKTTTEETMVTTAPRFTVQLSGLTQLWEGQSAHVECRLEPYPDSSMKVEWFHNGKPLNIGHRFRTMYDFGFCAMDILSAVAEDSGTYEVRATNRIGTASSSITIEIKAKSDFIVDTQHPEAMSKIARLEQKAPLMSPDDVQMIEKPNFGRPLRNQENLIEGQAMHMEATLTPVNDATMKVEWFFNGKPIPSGHRFRTTYDFGFVALDVLYAYPEDSGTYMCKATNAAGQAVTSCTVKITEVDGMQVQGDEERMRKIKALEASGERREEMSDLPLQKPVFTTPLQNQDNIVEGDRVHLECRLEPINDPNLRVEWYVNGVEIKAGHRFRTTHDFGYVALDVLYAYAEDSGTYLCKATNKLGEAVNSCCVTISAGQTVVMHSQVPKGMQQMDFSQQMEQTLKKYCTEIMLTQEDIYDVAKRQPPRFVTHIKDQMGLKEMEGAKFDCQLAPVGDPNMKVEWFFNGRPLPYKNRFTPIYDFGYVALQMNWVFGEDSGEYLCRATNKYGMDETRANLKSTARPGVIYDSQLPVGKMSLDKIRELEAQWDKVPEAADEGDKPRSKPDILLKPENVNCQEGEWARFSVRVSGHPRPRVMWIVNGNTAMSGNRFKIWYDGIYHLDIPKTRQYDTGKIEVMCRNALGQAYAACELNVKPRMDDYRAVLKNSPKQHEPGSKGYRKPDWVLRMEELKQSMSAEPVKPHFVQEIVNSRVKEMGTLTFTATVGGNPKPEVSWYLNQKLLHQHQFFQMRVRNDKAMLTIVNASPFVHKGEYQCKIYNSEGEAFSKARLDVLELTYEEKLTIEDERYAAVMIEHAAGIMKEKEQQRRVKEREDFKHSLDKMKEEKAQRQEEMQRELEAAKSGTQWKPDKTKAFKPKEEVKEEPVYKTPTERRIAQVYTNWKTPVKVEDTYPELEPEDFAPNQIPGVKCFVQVSETSVKGEEVVRDVAPQFFEDEHIIDELAKIHTLLKSNVKVSEIWHKFRAGEFKSLQQPSIQSALIKICEFIGHQRNVSMVLAQEAKEQSVRHPVGLKAFMRMLKFGSNIKTDKLFGDTIPKEMGKWSSTAEELKKVSQMINQGVETEEIIASCEAGKLPSLKKPETQQPLINIVEKHGHSVMVAQVLVEEAYRDAKDERLMVDRAWEVVHEQEMATAEVIEVKTDTVKAPVAPKQHTAVPIQKAVEQEPFKQHAPVETPQPHRTQTMPSFEPAQHTPVEMTPQEPKVVQMKPRTQRPMEPEPEPEMVQLKQTKKQIKPAPEPTPEQVQLKPTQRQAREVDQTSEDVNLKPTRKPGKDTEPQPEEVKLKPTRKPVKEVEEPKESVQLKPTRKIQKEVQPSSDQVQLKPAQKTEKPAAPKPAPVTQQVTQQVKQQTVQKIVEQQPEPEVQFFEQQKQVQNVVQETVISEPKGKVVVKKTVTKSQPQPLAPEREEVVVEEVFKMKPQEATSKTHTQITTQQVTVSQPQVVKKETIIVQQPEVIQQVTEQHVVMQGHQAKTVLQQPSATVETVNIVQQPTLVQQQSNEVVRVQDMAQPFQDMQQQLSQQGQLTEHQQMFMQQATQQQVTLQKQQQVIQKTVAQQSGQAQQVTVQKQQKAQQQQFTQQQTPIPDSKKTITHYSETIEHQTVPDNKADTFEPEAVPSLTKAQETKVAPMPTQQAHVTQVHTELPKVDVASIRTEEKFQTASASEVIVREEVQTHIQVSHQQQTTEAFEIATPTNVKMGDALRAVATYVADEQQENAMHLVEGERVYVQETSNSDWWFCKKHLTLEQGYVPAKLLAEEVSYTHYVQSKLNEKIMKLPVFDKLKSGVKSESPSMPNKLSPRKVKDGQEVMFEVKVNGVPRPTITWFRQTAIIKPSDEFQVFYTEDNTATLVIKEVFPEDAGMFTCVAKNLAGVASSSAEMVVEGPIYHSNESRKSLSRESSVCDILEGIPPTFANRPTIKTVEEGAQIEIDVRLVAIPEAEITWKKDGQVLRESQRLRLVKQKDVHAYRLIIIIKGAKTDDIGTYEIIAKNREGVATNQVQLRVVAPQTPKFEEKFQDQTVEEDGTIRLVAKIHGVPTPDVNWSSTFKKGLESCTVEENSEVLLECRTSKDKQCKWFKGKTELKSSQHIIIETEGLTHRMIINQVQSSDAGKYICQFDSTKTFCNLTIKTSGDFTERLQDVEVLEKQKAVLQVQVNSDKAQVTWHKDGEEIDQHNARFKLLSEGNIRKLVLAIATLHDEGEYTCAIGDHECTCELTVRELPAEITKKMKDQVVPKGGKASFEVELTKGDAVITWYMDEKEVRFSDHYQLSIDGKTQRLMVYNCQAEDCGTYKAVVGKSECTATLKVELQDEGDFVKKLPPQMDINFSTDATFVVEISKDFSVEWFRQGQKISASDKYVIKKAGKKRTLIVKNVSQADAVEYSCILANLKTTCKLNVVLLESAPTVEKQFSKQEIVTNKGNDITLRVPFKATPKPKAFWYHKGQLLNVENSPKYLPTLEEDCATLTVKTVESHECGEYQCKLCNGCGAAYADFTVKLLDKPSQPGQPEPVKVTNDTVTLNWTVPQFDGGRKITNYKIEHRNIKEQTWVVWNQTEIVIETTVVVTRLTTNEEYMFRIAAVNEIGISEYSMESRAVKVCEPVQPQPPNFTQRMQAVVTGLNQELILKCVVSGTPVPNVEWFQDGKPITNDTKYENFTATYTVRSTHENSGGMYMCKASNAAGYAECSATVIIQEPPKFEYEERLQCQRLNVGENYNVPLKVIGHPRPKVTWSRNDKPLKSSEHIQIRHEESEGMTSVGIKNLTKDDSSIFTITADNSAGKSQISLNLRVVEEERAVQQEVCQKVTEVKVAERPAPPMGPLIVSDIATSSCRLTWKASSYNGGMDITSYYIERKEKNEKQYQKLAEVGPNVFTYVVENLRQNCEYFFRVFACNPLGVSDSLDASVIIKSAFEKPGPPLGPFDVSNMAESSLTLSWEEPDFNGGSPITGYLLEMRESTKKAWKKVAETKEKQSEVTGVKKGTQYCFRVFAINSVGQGLPYAPEEPITAGKKITPPGPPTSLQVIDITTKTVTLAWAPPNQTGGADLIGYVIERRMQGEKKWEKVNTVDPSVTLFCVEMLREQSEYEFRVFAENPVGLSLEAAMTEMVRLKTHATPPSPPTAPLEVRPTGPTSLMIEWGMPESDGGAPLLGYVIAIRDIKRTMWIEVGQVDANFTRLHIKELQEEHEYHVRVFARNEVGSSGPLETEDPVKVIKPTDFVPMPEDDNAPSLSYSTTETLSWMREAGMDADIYSYARGRLLNRDEYFFKVWHHSDKVKAGSPKPE